MGVGWADLPAASAGRGWSEARSELGRPVGRECGQVSRGCQSGHAGP